MSFGHVSSRLPRLRDLPKDASPVRRGAAIAGELARTVSVMAQRRANREAQNTPSTNNAPRRSAGPSNINRLSSKKRQRKTLLGS